MKDNSLETSGKGKMKVRKEDLGFMEYLYNRIGFGVGYIIIRIQSEPISDFIYKIYTRPWIKLIE